MTSPEPRFATVLTEFEEGTLTLTLNRPDKLNALNDTMYEELLSALDAADADDAVKAVIVTGAGRAFCAGADLSGRGEAFTASRGDACKPARDRGGVIALKIFNSAKPVIGAINGPAIGLGASITLPMDIRLCSTSAKFGFVYVRRGIAVEGAASWFLPRAVGHGLAMEWALTGRHIEADEAVRGGLVRGAYRSSALLPAARALARSITETAAPVSVALTRRLIWRMSAVDHPMTAHRNESRAISSRRTSADAREGVESFLERRAPAFTDRVSCDLPDVFSEWSEPPFDREDRDLGSARED